MRAAARRRAPPRRCSLPLTGPCHRGRNAAGTMMPTWRPGSVAHVRARVLQAGRARLPPAAARQSGRELASVARRAAPYAGGAAARRTPAPRGGDRPGRVVAGPRRHAVRGGGPAAARDRRRPRALATTRLEGVARRVPHLAAPAARPRPGDVLDVGAHRRRDQLAAATRSRCCTRSSPRVAGDLLWLRPDQFRKPREEAMAEVVGEAVAQGRASRAIYPVRACRRRPTTLEPRAPAGEQIRLLPELPTRMFIIGATHAVLPEPLGFADEPRSLVRQRGPRPGAHAVVRAVWERAAAVPGLDQGEARARAAPLPAAQLAARRQGRADRPHPRHQPAHGAPPGRR